MITKDEVLDKLNIQAFYLEAVPSLKITDTQGVGLCPFHNDREHPNFHADLERGLFKCWACGAKGSIFDFVMRRDGVTYREALECLGRRVGLDAPAPGQQPQILRSFPWWDADGNLAYKHRLDTDEPGRKCRWAQDQEGLVPGLGPCRPTLRHLDAVAAAEQAITCEGERDDDTVNTWLKELNLHGPIIATTTPHGASDVKPAYLKPLRGKKTIYLSGDNDDAGRGYVEKCGAILAQHTKDLRRLFVPSPYKDWTEWAEAGATAAEFKALLEAADPICPRSNPRDEGLDESNPTSIFRPVDLGSLLKRPEQNIPYIVDGFLAEGTFALLAGHPKVGKTTLAYDAVAKVATGQPWLGRQVRKGKVLVLALEEHERDVVRRLRAMGDPRLEGHVMLWMAPLPFTATLLDDIVAYVQQEQIELVLVDTLHAWWGITDENSSADVMKAGLPLLAAIRRTPAAWLCLVHSRKSGGDHGQEIRGSSALLGLVDVAMTLKRTEGNDNQRYLEAVSRYADTPGKVVIGLGKDGYEFLGDPESVSAQGKAERVWSALSDVGQTVPELMETTGLSKQDMSRALQLLRDRVVREGEGHKKSPYRYRRNSICPSPTSRGASMDESNPAGSIPSVQPPIPVDESNVLLEEEIINLC